MQFLRQFGMAILISVISLGLVVGGLSLALSENVTPPPMATATLWLPTFSEFITPADTLQAQPANTLAPAATNTLPPPTSCTPPSGWIGVLVGPSDTLDTIAPRYKSTSQALIQGNCLLTASLIPGSVLYVPPVQAAPATAAVTSLPCGAPYGWVRYSVQSGDTLYHIATSYGITTAQLQRANCLGFSTLIRVGQPLWVPNLPTRTPGVTVVPTFYLPTEVIPTQPLTETPLPYTGTPAPTSIPLSNNTPIPTDVLTPLP